MATDLPASAVLSDLGAGASDVRRVVALCVLYALAAGALIPFVTTPLAALPHFAGLYGLAVLVADVCTYLLLLAQFRVSGARWLLQLAMAYLFSALMAGLHILTFPGAFLPEGPVLGATKTVGWLYVAWNLGFTALLLLAIASVPAARRTVSSTRKRQAALSGVVVVVVALALAAGLVAADNLLPPTVIGNRFSPLASTMNYLRGALALCALVLILGTARRNRLVVLWLSLALVAASVGPVLTDLGGQRYTFGWYAGRVSFVFASYTLLAVLLVEFARLQQALSTAVQRLEAQAIELTDAIQRRERAERTLVNTERMNAIGQLASGVAHDFNNLLTGVLANLEVILRVGIDGKARRSAESAKQAALRGARLTRSLLAFGGKQPLHSEAIDPNELINRVLLLLQRAAGPTIKLAFVPAGVTWTCQADPAQLEVALLNLVVNARDAMPSGGSAEIATRNVARGALAPERPGAEVAPGDYVEISVQDTGVGIAAADQDRVFEPFFTTKGALGTGLGLSQVKGFAHQSGGDVTIESAEARGTVVRLLLPRASEEVANGVPDAA